MYACDVDEEYVEFQQRDVTDSGVVGDNDFRQIIKARLFFVALSRCVESSATEMFMRK